MRGTRRRKTLIVLALVACVLATACDTAWNDMTPWSYGPPCGRPTWYAIHNGDFTPDEMADIHDAIREVAIWSAVDIRFVGIVDWRNGSPQQPADVVSIERRDAVPGAPFVSYGNPNVVNGVYTRGVLFIGTTMHPPTRVPPGYGTGQTFFGLVAHEASHAFVGIGDMYNQGDGHPGLLMGNGRNTMSNFAAGDLIGLINKGCRTPEDKAARTDAMQRAYG
jgi:hypothetical protein